VKIGKGFSFEAAHRLQNHEGKCRNLHGHSYRVEVSVEGPSLIREGSSSGMLFDFQLLSDWWKTVEPVLDHTTILEESDPLTDLLRASGRRGTSMSTFPWPPTAENLASYLWTDLSLHLRHLGSLPASYVTNVRVYETAKSWAEAGDSGD